MGIYSIIFLLLSNAVNSRREMSILYSRDAIIILFFSGMIALKSLNVYFLHEGIGLYGGLFHATPLTQIFHIFIFSVSATILQLTAFYPLKISNTLKFSNSIKVLVESYAILENVKYLIFEAYTINKDQQRCRIIEYPLIILFIIIGGIFLVSASDIVSIFLSIELQSYGLYLLCTLDRNSERSTEAGLTYFLLGGLSSCFILLGTSLLYANSGTTNLDGYYVIAGLSSIANEYTNNIANLYKPLYLNISLLIMSVGFLFKISAAPFHFWSPKVYDAVPTIVTTFVAIIPKISILIFLLELIHYTSNFYFAFSWTSSLLISSFLSLIIGSVLGLAQYEIKKLFAYSTISHLGFMLLALSINSLESTHAFLFYLIQYSISNLNAFVLLISLGFSLYSYQCRGKFIDLCDGLQDKNNSPIQLITQLNGYYKLEPTLVLSLAITLFSFAGIPPLIGFFGKLSVLSAALNSGYVFLSLTAILTSVISAGYYLGVIKQIIFSKHEYKLSKELKDASFKEDGQIRLSSSLTITISILTLALLLFIFTPKPFLSITITQVLVMFNT